MKKNAPISAAPDGPTPSFANWVRVCLRVLVFEIKTCPQYNLSFLRKDSSAHVSSRIQEKKLVFKKGMKALKTLKTLNLELISNLELNTVIKDLNNELDLIKEQISLVPKGRPSKSTRLQLILFYGTLHFEADRLVRFFDTSFNGRVASFEANKRGVKIRDLEFLKVFLTSRKHPITNNPDNRAFQIKELRRTLKKSLIERNNTESKVLQELKAAMTWATKLASLDDDKFVMEVGKSPYYKYRVKRRAIYSAKRDSQSG
jgi:hypothetical protein